MFNPQRTVEFEDLTKVDTDSLGVDLDNTMSRTGSSMSVHEVRMLEFYCFYSTLIDGTRN